MQPSALAIALALLATTADLTAAQTPDPVLPHPHFTPQKDDPEWLKLGAQVHGHLGPWMTIGMRLGAAGRAAIGAHGYFDVEVACTGPFDVPPRSCMLDGLQLATGATLGKRNLTVSDGDEYRIRFKNTRSGKVIVVTLSQPLRDELAELEKKSAHIKGHAEQMSLAETVAREIAHSDPTTLFEFTTENAKP